MDNLNIEASGLPAHCYTDPTILDRELQSHFVAGWVSVGVTQMVPNPGDAHPVKVAGRPLMITRDRNGSVHVFHNVCRHRGTQLITEPCHRANATLTCPYHTWSYRLDGALVAAPYQDGTAAGALDEETKSGLGLIRIATAIWCDIVFVNLSATAQDFDEFIQPLAARWAAFDFTLMRLATTQEFRVASNWKLVCENFLDSYHLPFVHPQMGKAGDASYTRELNVMGRNIIGYIMPKFAVGHEDMAPGPLFPNTPPSFSTALDLVYVFPNTLLLLTASWLQLITIQPDGPGDTDELLFGYLVGEEAVAQAGDDLAAELGGVNGQDLEILARMQAGRGGDASNQAHLTATWDNLAVELFKRVAEAY